MQFLNLFCVPVGVLPFTAQTGTYMPNIWDYFKCVILELLHVRIRDNAQYLGLSGIPIF